MSLTIRKTILLALPLLFYLATSAQSQESVEVPQVLQRDVHSFNLTIDSLKTLTQNISKQTEAITRELELIKQNIELMPRNSRRRRLERWKFEEKLSDFFIQRYATLEEMQNLRLTTLSHLEGILDQLEKNDDSAFKNMRGNIREELRKNNEKMAQAKLEMVQILGQLQKNNQSEAEILRLNEKYRRLQSDRVQLYRMNQLRLQQLLAMADQKNEELPAVQKALRGMWEYLQSGFDWIDAEMIYLQLYSDYRKSQLNIDAQLIEVYGSVERFREAVDQINESNEALSEIERFQKLLEPDKESDFSLPEVPPVRWRGGLNERVRNRALTPAEIDSLKNALEQELKATNQKTALKY